jgi:diguanylate cyclase (GGDEF)-like protein
LPDGGWVSTHEDVTERRRSEERIAYLARHDTLTGLANRMLFRESMEGALARVAQGEALHCIDLDQFKGINDVLGHAVGDALLKEVAGRIRRCVKDKDLVARFGGDEFAVVQVSLHSANEAASLATRIVRELSQPYDCDGHRSPISASIGVAIAPSDGATPIRSCARRTSPCTAPRRTGGAPSACSCRRWMRNCRRVGCSRLISTRRSSATGSRCSTSPWSTCRADR